jgi:dihydropteroate synthase
MDMMNIRNQQFNWGHRTYIMGVINTTPDSFSDGGQFNSLEQALNQVQSMVDSGVDIIDIGGESTRPGASPVTVEEELRRVIPLIESIRKSTSSMSEVVISIDTSKSVVAKEAIAAGADIINDVSAGLFDESMFRIVASLNVPIIIMHLRGNPMTMQQMTDYQDVVNDVINALNQRIEVAKLAGIDLDNLIIDPGIGFAKTYEQNIDILRRLKEFKRLNLPLLVGVSRKSFIGHILQQSEPSQRVWGTAAACCAAIAGGADILRVHDVKEMTEVSRVSDILFK